MPNPISNERQTAFYIGMALQIVGGLLFASTFVTFLIHFGDFSNFESRVKSDGFRAFGGIALLIVGGIVRGIGAHGFAGSGMFLDPERARTDLEPYSRMAGGMVKDALDEADIKINQGPPQVIMVRCPACQHLNQESAKFCQECGAKVK